MNNVNENHMGHQNMVHLQSDMLPIHNQSLSLFSNVNDNYDRSEMIYLNHQSDPINSDMWMDPNFCNSLVSKSPSINSYPNQNLDLLGFLSSGIEINGNHDNFADFPMTNSSMLHHKTNLTPTSMSKNNFSLPMTDQSLPTLVQNISRSSLNNELLLERTLNNCNHINLTGNGNHSLSTAMNNVSHMPTENLLHENAISNGNDLPFPDNLINSTTDLSGLECLNVLANSGCDRDVPENGQWENINLITQAGLPSVPQMISQVDNIHTNSFNSHNSSLEDFPEAIFAQMVEELPCYKCKFCSSIYITFSREEMVSHLKTLHEKELILNLKQNSAPVVSQSTLLPPWNTVASCGKFTTQELNPNIHTQNSNTPNGNQTVINNPSNKCSKSFNTLEDLQKHVETNNRIQVLPPVTQSKPTNGYLTPIAPKNGTIIKQPIPTNVVKRKRPMTPLKKSSRDRQKAQQGCYICEFKGCNVRFRLLENLEYHCKCHANGKNPSVNNNTSFACPECSFKCATWNSMSGHVWRRHGIDLELHACDQCSFRTYSLSKLENLHKRTHSSKRSYTCPKCNMGFKTYKILWGHKRSCMDLKKPPKKLKPKVSCNICNTQFLRERLLSIHLETVHHKVRPYLCQQCGYTANRPTTLKMHMRQHSGEKPFACDLCTFRTADHNTLRRHNMTHSGEKPYKCSYCPYACIQSTTYKAHLRKKHPDKNHGLMFTCKLCNFETVNEQLLLVHTASHKPEENNSSSNGITALNSHIESQSQANQCQDSLAENQIISLVQAVQFSIHDREIT